MNYLQVRQKLTLMKVEYIGLVVNKDFPYIRNRGWRDFKFLISKYDVNNTYKVKYI